MRGCGAFLRWVVAIAALVAPAAGLAQEAKPPLAPPKAPEAAGEPFQTEVEAIRKLVASGNWKGGKDAIAAFFKAHDGDSRVGARLPEIEEDLRRSVYQLSGAAPKPTELLGRGATKWSAATRVAEFVIPRLENAQGWAHADGVDLFDVLFEGDVTVEVSGADPDSLVVFLGFDSEKKGGYAFAPRTVRWQSHQTTSIVALRLDPGAREPEMLGSIVELPASSPRVVRYMLTATKLDVQLPGVSPAVKSTPRSDRKYRKGFVALRSKDVGRRAAVGSLKITGKVEATFAKRQIAQTEARRFREWSAKSFDRAAHIPAWVLDAERDAVAWRSRLPFDCPEELKHPLRELQRFVFEESTGSGDEDEVDSAPEAPAPRGLPAMTAAWVQTLVARVQGRHADAEMLARRVAEEAPGFAPAWTVIGLSLLERGQTEAARAVLEESRDRDAHFAPTYDALVLAGFRDGDFTSARRALALAAEAGTATKLTGDLRRALARMARGPAWKTRYEAKTAHFVVASDASAEVCAQVGKVLEEALGIYHQKFRPLERKGTARVYVFSGAETYLEYAADQGRDLSGTLGVYIPRFRELCVFLHENRPELWNTVRHEAFHQYLHNFVERAPIWFNEGYAEFFGFARREQGSTKVGQVDAQQAELAREVLDDFTPLAELFVMEPGEFMADADVHYPQSWAVIHYLRTPDDPRLKGVLDAYTDAVLAGRSQREAYDAVLAPHVAAIEAGVKRHVQTMR